MRVFDVTSIYFNGMCNSRCFLFNVRKPSELITMWGPQDSVQLVYNSNNYGLWYANTYSYGVYKPT